MFLFKLKYKNNFNYLQNAKGTLVSHFDEGTHAEFEDQILFVTGKVTHILQDEELWSVVVTILKINHNTQMA